MYGRETLFTKIGAIGATGAGVLLFNVALWRTRVAPRWIAGFGLLVTALQAGYLTVILSSVLPGGRMLIPMIWGLTLPPPGDYLLALWFILVGISLMRGRVP